MTTAKKRCQGNQTSSKVKRVKAAGESLCFLLSKFVVDINIFSPRLPKLATGQAVSLIGQRIDSPDVIMLNQLNQFHKLGRENIYA